MGLILLRTVVMVSGRTMVKTYLTLFLQVQPKRVVPETQLRHWKGEPMQVAQGWAQAMHYPSRKPFLRAKPGLHSEQTLGARHSRQLPEQRLH